MGRERCAVLRPEDAAPSGELAARSPMRQTVIRGSAGTWKNTGLMLLSALIVAVALAAAAAVGAHDGGDLAIRLVLALIAAWLLAWPFSGVIRTGVCGFRRWLELDRLFPQWHRKTTAAQLRAEAGEDATYGAGPDGAGRA